MSVERMLLKGPMPELRKMKVDELRSECQMWRNVWNWVPSEVRYFVARTGQMVGVTQRNYKRYLGVLLDTHWTLDEIEIGVYDKIYDTIEGRFFFERKIVKMKIGSLIDYQWIVERTPEEEVTGAETIPAPEDIAAVEGRAEGPPSRRGSAQPAPREEDLIE